MFIKQDPMRRVLYSLVPIFIWSVYLYGWRVVALTAFVYMLGIIAEYIFEKGKNKKVSEAVLVTCGLYALSLPPAVPFWAAGVGILFAVIFGKEVFGGFGRNVYNPAITGRTFAYISFPLMLQTTWMIPGNFGTTAMNGLIQGSTGLEAIFMLVLVAIVYWVITKNEGKTKTVIISGAVAVLLTVAFYVTVAYVFQYDPKAHNRIALNEIDVVSTATPIEIFRGLAKDWHHTVNIFGWNVNLEDNSPLALFFGVRVGAAGEGAIFLIVLAAIYLLWTKTANWRPMIWTFLSAAILTTILYYTGVMDARFPLFAGHRTSGSTATQLLDILGFLMAGSLVYAAVFMSTDPVSSPKKFWSQHLYGIIIGALTVTIRVFAGFSEGVSFAILTANTFASLIDEVMPANKKKASAKGKPAAATQGGDE